MMHDVVGRAPRPEPDGRAFPICGRHAMNRSLSVRAVLSRQSVSADWGAEAFPRAFTPGTSARGGGSRSRRAKGQR